MILKKKTYTIAHPFAGIGGTALGTDAASVRISGREVSFECVGGIDFDPLACQDYERLTGSRALCADMHTLQPAQLRKFMPKCPDVVMASPPCKGHSGLLSAEKAAEEKYQEMNMLLLDFLFLFTSTWEEKPAIIFIENVPRIAARGKHLIDQVCQLLEAEGYAIHMGNHDCGEIGNLAQHRRRWFLMARLLDRVPHPVYRAPKKRVRACGEVLEALPIPGDTITGGLMHDVPQLSWQNWVRLSLIPPGGDWRDLPGVLAKGQTKREQFRRVPVGKWTEPVATVTGSGGSAADNVADPRVPIVLDRAHLIGMMFVDGRPAGGGVVHHKFEGESTHVTAWDQPARTVTGNGRVQGSGAAAVADPRRWHNGALGVASWKKPANAITGQSRPVGGRFAVGDPRWKTVLGVNPWTEPMGVVTGEGSITGGKFAVSDPRVDGISGRRGGSLGVTPWNEPIGVVTGADPTAQGGKIVGDPRFGHVDKVTPWTEPVGTITRSPAPSSGAGAVADPRVDPSPFALPTDNPNRFWNKYAVTDWTKPAPTVIGAVQLGSGAPAVNDPRLEAVGFDVQLGCEPRAGAYKVMSWEEAAATITGSMSIDNGPAAVADPRVAMVKKVVAVLQDNLGRRGKKAKKRAAPLKTPWYKRPPPWIPVIIAADGTWHRPLTTYELLALQGLPLHDREGKPVVLAGSGHTRWREAVGNAVPPPAAQAIAEVILSALLLTELGQARSNGEPIWVRPWREVMAS
jgi:site-specific DNA-cytosine methylase